MLGAQDSGRFGVIRIADTAAWLHRVTIHSTHLDVHVRGTETAGTIIEVNSASLRESKPVGKTGRIRFGLPAGLPDDAWLFLKSDLSLLDYRVLGHKLASVNELRESGVRIVLPDDPDTEIQAVLAAGEGVDVEYKRELPRDNIESKRKVLKTVAAFANSGGGDVVFGVDPDEVTIVGLAPGEVGVPARDRLGHLVHAIVVPTPEFEVKHFAIDGKELVVLRVARGQSGPYGLRFGQAPPEFYVRRGSSTYPASQTDIRSVALSQPEALVSQRAASISGSP
jgi:hypothetical protein